MAVKLAKPINYRSVANITALDFQDIMENLNVCKDFAVAISGGPDSLALALLAVQYSKANNFKFTAISIDHSLRPESKEEIKWIKALMRRYKIKFVSIKLKDKNPNSNIMAYARERRYDLLTQYCKRSKIPYLLTAHHLDDEIENFLMRLIRGSGIKGLSSSSPTYKHRRSGIKIVRPLLSFSKKSLIKYLSIYKQNYIIDPTNKDKRFDRSRIRVLTTKLISEGLNKSRFSNVLDNLKKAESAIQSSVAEYGKSLICVRGRSSLAINIKDFISIPEEIQFRLIFKIIEHVGKKKQKPRAKSILSLIQKLSKRDFKNMNIHSCTFSIKGKEIIITLENSNLEKKYKKQQFNSFTKRGISDLFT